MGELKSTIRALAKLDKTPDEIMAEKRAAFAREKSKNEKWNKSWWRRYASWRQEAYNDDGYNLTALVFSLVFVCVQIALLVVSIVFERQILFALAGTTVVGVFSCQAWVKDQYTHADNETLARAVLFHFKRYLILPLMPFVRVIDIIIAMNTRRDRYYDMRDAGPGELKKETLPELVPAYYAEGIEQAREELLGSTSELRVTAADLNTRLERVDGQIERLAVRLIQAAGDPNREGPLMQAKEALAARRLRIHAAGERVQETIAKTSAVLDECKIAVSKLHGPLEDAMLIGEIERESESDVAAIASAHHAVDAHVEQVRSKLIQLAAAITSQTFALPAADQEESLEEYFTRVDRVADKVSAI